MNFGCLVVLGIPLACFLIGYNLGVGGSKSLAHKFLKEKGLTGEFDRWVETKAGIR